MKHRYLSLLLLLILVLFSACTFDGKADDDEIIIIEPPEPPEFETFSFEKPVELTLDSAIFQIGDTIKLRFEIPENKLVNLFNRDTVFFLHPNLSYNFSILKLDQLGNPGFNTPFIDYQVLAGQELHFSQSQTFANWAFHQSCPPAGENLAFEIHFMPKLSGTYSFELATAFIQWGSGLSCNGSTPSGTSSFGEMNLFFYPYAPRLDLLYDLPESTQQFIAYLVPNHPSLNNRRVVFFRVDE